MVLVSQASSVPPFEAITSNQPKIGMSHSSGEWQQVGTGSGGLDISTGGSQVYHSDFESVVSSISVERKNIKYDLK